MAMTTINPVALHRPSSFALPFLAFAIACTLALLGALAFGDIAYNRTRFTAWATILLTAPALVLFILWIGRRPLRGAWLHWWAVGLAMYLIHLWYGFGVMLKASFPVTYALQGSLVATSNFLLAGVWAISVLVAWFGLAIAWIHVAATLLFILSTIGSTVVFGRPPSPWIGAIMIAALGAATLFRLTRPRHDTVPVSLP